jgi:uncharacterized protein YjbJ (UPF0337 family)
MRPPLMKIPDASNMPWYYPSVGYPKPKQRWIGPRREIGFEQRVPGVHGRRHSSPHWIVQKEAITMDSNLDETKGRVKQAVGDLTGDEELKKEGKADEVAGKVKEFAEDVKDKVDDLVDKVKDRFKKD